jgi:hypothetical protein
MRGERPDSNRRPPGQLLPLEATYDAIGLTARTFGAIPPDVRRVRGRPLAGLRPMRFR